MYVSTILDTKGRDVVTVEADCTLLQAAEFLASRKIGTLVITDYENVPIGILSERDIVRAVAESGPSGLDQPVSAYMSSPVQTTNPGQLIRAIMEQMTEGRFRHIPVLENGRMVGIVSIGDVVKHRLAEFEAETSAMRDYIASA
jgi:CBS domain-containing protein